MTVVMALLAALLALVLLRPATAIGNCCCGAGGGGGAVCCLVCNLFSTLPREYTLTVAGITDPDPLLCPAGSCTRLNGSFTLRWAQAVEEDGGVCAWFDSTADRAPCNSALPSPCGNYRTWTLTLLEVNPDEFLFIAQPSLSFSTHIYFLPVASWNCTGANVMTRSGGTTNICSNFPATVTVTAGSPRVVACQCYPPFDLYASIWSVSFSNIKGCCSPEINDTFTLPFSSLASQCAWHEVIASDCPSAQLWIVLEYTNDTVQLRVQSAQDPTAGGCVHALYLMPAAGFNPLGANTLTRSGVDCTTAGFCGECTGWPDTLQITPA